MMASIGLVVTGINEDARLLKALDEAAVPIAAAFWLLTSEHSDWQLVLATPILDDHSVSEVLQQVIDVRRALDDVDYLMDKLTVVGTNDRRVWELRNALPRGLPKAGYCLGRFYSRDMEVLDSYVYRMLPRQADETNGTTPKQRKGSNGTSARPDVGGMLRLKSEVGAALRAAAEVSPRSSG